VFLPEVGDLGEQVDVGSRRQRIGSQRDGDPRGEEPRHRSLAHAQPLVAARARHDGDAARLQPGDVLVIDVNAVHGEGSRGQDAQPVEVFDRRQSGRLEARLPGAALDQEVLEGAGPVAQELRLFVASAT
jgi:hypothetical protein